MEKNLNAIIKELLEQLKINPEKTTLTLIEADSYALDLQLPEREAGALIGYHGDTISALQLMLNLLFYKKTGTWCKLVVNIGDYRQKREEALTRLAQETVEKVKASGQPMALFNLNPFERRTIHTLLAEDNDVTTESEGEGRNRHLIVKPATASHEASREVGSATK